MSELAVVTKVKDLLYKLREKSLKKFRFVFVNRMQNLTLDPI